MLSQGYIFCEFVVSSIQTAQFHNHYQFHNSNIIPLPCLAVCITCRHFKLRLLWFNFLPKFGVEKAAMHAVPEQV